MALLPFTVTVFPLSANVLFVLTDRFPFIVIGVAAGNVFTEAAPAPNDRFPKLVGNEVNVKLPVPLRFTVLALFKAKLMFVGKHGSVVFVEVYVAPETSVNVFPPAPVIPNPPSANVTPAATVMSPFIAVAPARAFVPEVESVRL